MSRRVVITGQGLVCPLGSTAEALWGALREGRSGVDTLASLPGNLPTHVGAEARQFTGASEDFGPLEKTLSRNITKNVKVMCREMIMGVAVAQHAITYSALKVEAVDRDRFGVLYGSDYMLTLP